MKNILHITKASLLLTCALGLVTTAHAQTTTSVKRGGEVGSGGGSSQGRPKKLEQQDQTTQERGPYWQSCSTAVGVLRRALRMVQYQGTNFSASKRILIKGLRDALQEFDTNETSLTKNAISRGLTLSTQFSGGCNGLSDPTSKQQCLELETRTALHFIYRFYQYILDSVYPLDEGFYFPYVDRYYPRCRSNDCMPDEFYNDFFVAYRDSAAALLSFYIGDGRNGMPEGLATDRYELRVAERVLLWAARDLDLDLFRRRFTCLTEELLQTSGDLALFNAGNTEMFKNSRYAVQYGRNAAMDGLSELQHRGNTSGPICRRSH